MDLADYVRVVCRRWRLIAAAAVLGLLTAVLVTSTATTNYEAQTQLFVGTSGSDDSDAALLNQGGQFAQQRVKSYADIVASQTVTGPVIEQLDLDLTTQDLARAITATAPVDTVLINVAVRDVRADRAQAIANAVAEQFTVTASRLETPVGGTRSPVKVSVVREAELPTTPVTPRPALNLAVGLGIGMFAGLAAALLRERLDTRVGDADDLHSVTGLPVLGIVEDDPSVARLPTPAPGGTVTVAREAYRRLRANLQFVDGERMPSSLVVTSARPGAGASTTTAHLAEALSSAGLRIVVVDADLRRSGLSARSGRAEDAGLSQVVTGLAALDDVLRPRADGSAFLPAGLVPGPAVEVLASDGMRKLLAELEGRFDVVLVDAPALLADTDAAVLSARASGVVLVVEHARTPRRELAEAQQLLRNVDARIYGTVLNRVPLGRRTRRLRPTTARGG